jgi:hypothetical protein
MNTATNTLSLTYPHQKKSREVNPLIGGNKDITPNPAVWKCVVEGVLNHQLQCGEGYHFVGLSQQAKWDFTGRCNT